MKQSEKYKKAEKTYADLIAQVGALIGDDNANLETVSHVRNGLIARVVQG